MPNKSNSQVTFTQYLLGKGKISPRDLIEPSATAALASHSIQFSFSALTESLAGPLSSLRFQFPCLTIDVYYHLRCSVALFLLFQKDKGFFVTSSNSNRYLPNTLGCIECTMQLNQGFAVSKPLNFNNSFNIIHSFA